MRTFWNRSEGAWHIGMPGGYKFRKLFSGLMAFSMAVTTMPVATLATEAAANVQENQVEATGEMTLLGNRRVLTTDKMTVEVGQNFPYIIQYNLDGETFYGQTEAISTIKINGQSIEVGENDVNTSFSGTKAVYEMTLKGTNVDCVITAEITVEKNTASFDITKVENKLTEVDANGYQVYPVQEIEIPNHSLISVRSTQTNAHLKGAKMSSNTRVSGDRDFDVTAGMKLTGNASSEDFMYGFISNDKLSAGLWSNSEYNGTHVASYIPPGGASNTRVMATVSSVSDGATSLGLGSTMWYYDRKITVPVYTDATNNVSESRVYVVEHEIMPSAKVIITGDENGDGDIDWQDGAVAFRSIMHNPVGCEVVPDLVNYRIAMNFGSQAANPFLMNLDGVKRIYLNTEGLGQGVLLKGYGSEGHDSGHPDYGDIGKRIGGAEDMNTLLVEGKKMGALFGVHVNCSEMYTEAKAFSDELSGGYNGLDLGWNWLDQGIGINTAFDLASGQREKRFQELYDQVGNNLDFIYVDVWGNGVASPIVDGESAWYSRMLAREINGFGWRLATEWGPTQEYDSTLQHWAADMAYSNFISRGENSAVMRFLHNHQKDSWIGDWPGSTGAAQMPLLGGLNMIDFEGWQGRTDYNHYIKTMFRHNLITKYLQHYQIVDWIDGEEVSLPADTIKGVYAPAATWKPEMEITLRNTEDADDNTEIVVKRQSNNYKDTKAYRSRTIKVNDVIVSQGAPTGGDGSNPGDESYLIPWNWGPNGEDLASEDLKMYHWNTKGGETTWTLTKDWEGFSNVIVYKLTDEGKKEKTVVNVVDNRITLSAEAETPYVIFKGEKENLSVDWQTSKYIYDTGFNDTNIKNKRTVSGDAEIVKNLSANNMLRLGGGGSVSMELTNLKAGQEYALYIGVDNRSQEKAYMTVKNGNEVLGTNYTGASFVQNIVSSDQHHTGSGATVDDGISYFQNMFVFFTAKGKTATLNLQRDAGEGYTYFDDIRIVESKMNVIRGKDSKGNITAVYNDFENNVQGIWPFVISGPGGIADNRIHLSEWHGKYTAAGFMTKKVDDVLDGNWSVKINGLTQANNMIYQTIPQNFHFIPGKTYYVSFDYQMGGDQTYELRLGDGTNKNVQSWSMAKAVGETKHFGCSFTAGDSENNWIGIFSTGTAAETHGLGGKQLSFSGYQDFVLDNIKIEQTDMKLKVPEQTEVESAKEPLKFSVEFTDAGNKNTKIVWDSTDKNVARVDEEGNVYFVGFGSSMITATAVIDGVETTLSCGVAFPEERVVSATFQGAWSNNYNSIDESAVQVTDRAASTIWHSEYSTSVTESNPAVITVYTEEEIASFDRIAFRQRTGPNGVIQKYQYIIGTGFDPGTHTITGETKRSQVITISGKQGEEVDLPVEKGTAGNYLQIRVLQGNNGFAAMADILIDSIVSRNTNEEQGYLNANKAHFVETVKTELGNTIASANNIKNQNYTDTVWQAFQQAIAAAEAAKNLEDIVQMSEAAKALENAQKALDLDKAKTDLRAEMNLALEELEKGQQNYTDLCWTAFNEACTKAKQVNFDTATIKDINRLNSLREELLETRENLNKVIQAQQTLTAAITPAAAIKNKGQQNYTDASWKAFITAYNDAEAGKDSENAAYLENLLAELTKAQKGLAQKPEEKLKNGDTVVFNEVLYKVTDAAKKTVIAVNGTNKSGSTSITIPSAVVVNNETCTVTEISANAFKGFTKLKKVTIGSNVVKVGNAAFNGCKNLKNIKVQSKVLKSFGKKSLKGTNAKLTVKIQKKMSTKKLRTSLIKSIKKAGNKKVKVK